MMFFNGTAYSVLFLLMMAVLPYELGRGSAHPELIGGIACAVHILIIGIVTYRIQNDRIDFGTGLVRLSTSFMSGCGNITLLYIFPVLFYYYLHALAYTVIGFFKGKAYTEDSWCKLVLKRLNQDHAGRW